MYMNMLSKDDIKKVAEQLWKRQPTLQDKQIMHPARDWHIGLIVGVVVILGTISWSTMTYLENRNQAGHVSVEEKDNGAVYRASAVEEALTIFEKRAVVRNTLVANGVATKEESTVASSTEETNIVEQASSTTNQIDSPEAAPATTSVPQ
jgi:uncharacterized membrane protein YjgN (DUF898 family)